MRTTPLLALALFLYPSDSTLAQRTADLSPFHLISGAELSAKVGGQLRPVVAADKDGFTVRGEQKPQHIPLRRIEDIQIARKIKLTNLFAELKDISAELSSDAARQAQFRSMTDAVGSAEAAAVQTDRAVGDFNRSVQSAEIARNTLGPPDQPKLGDEIADAGLRAAYGNLQTAVVAAAQSDRFASGPSPSDAAPCASPSTRSSSACASNNSRRFGIWVRRSRSA